LLKAHYIQLDMIMNRDTQKNSLFKCITDYGYMKPIMDVCFSLTLILILKMFT